MKLALKEGLRFYTYKRRIGQVLTENRLTKEKKLPSKLNHPAEPQSSSFPMRKSFAKIKSTTRRIIDGLHTVKRERLVSCKLNFPKL